MTGKESEPRVSFQRLSAPLLVSSQWRRADRSALLSHSAAIFRATYRGFNSLGEALTARREPKPGPAQFREVQSEREADRVIERSPYGLIRVEKGQYWTSDIGEGWAGQMLVIWFKSVQSFSVRNPRRSFGVTPVLIWT